MFYLCVVAYVPDNIGRIIFRMDFVPFGAVYGGGFCLFRAHTSLSTSPQPHQHHSRTDPSAVCVCVCRLPSPLPTHPTAPKPVRAQHIYFDGTRHIPTNIESSIPLPLHVLPIPTMGPSPPITAKFCLCRSPVANGNAHAIRTWMCATDTKFV